VIQTWVPKSDTLPGELEKLVVSLNGICDDSAYPVLFMDEACKFK